MLIWKGRRRKAPDTPPIDVKNEITIAISGGNRILVFTPETGNSIFRKSMEYYMSTALQMEALQIIIYL